MKRIVIVSMVVGLFTAWPLSAQNIIGNAGLEDLAPAFWTPLNGTLGTDVFASDDTASSGFNSFKITKAAAGANAVGWESDNNANLYWNNAKSGTYALSVKIKTDGVNISPANDDAKIGMVVTFNDASGTLLTSTTVWADQSAASSSWTTEIGAAILSEAPAEVIVQLIMGKDATGTVYFDGIGVGTDPWSMGVFNGSAEEVDGWLSWYGGKGNYTRVTNTFAHSGTYAVEMVQPDTMSTESELVYYTIPYPVEAGEWYKVGVWIKTVGVIDSTDYKATHIRTDAILERVNMVYFFHTDADLATGWNLVGGDKFVYVDQTVADSGWTHYVVAEQAPATATGISMRARFNHDTSVPLTLMTSASKKSNPMMLTLSLMPV